MNITELTTKLVSIPSYVGDTSNEIEIAEFIFQYLKQFKYLKTEKQFIDKKRFNVIATTKGKPALLIAGHMDTVEPKQGWTKNQFGKNIIGDKLYGLGAADMKGGIAAILCALSNLKDISGLTLLFYCDEEYDFAGMKYFINNYKRPLPKLAIVAEPSNLKIGNSCRGLIDIKFSVQGKTGHAANPKNGVNAITKLNEILIDLNIWLQQFKNKQLDKPTMNVAYLKGGLRLPDKNKLVLGQQGNNIADYAETIIDIRTTSNKLRAKQVKQWIVKQIKKQRLALLDFEVRHDLGSLFTDPKKLSKIESILKQTFNKFEYEVAQNNGYGDGQMLQEYLEMDVISLGTSFNNIHGVDEFVTISSLKQIEKIYTKLIQTYCD